MSAVCDLNTELANFAMTCAGKARMAKQDADDIRALPTFGSEMMTRDKEARAKVYEQAAALWSRREAAAKRGTVLLSNIVGDDNEMSYRLTYQTLIGQAVTAARVVYEDAAAAPPS